MEISASEVSKKELFEKLVKDNMKRAYFTALGLCGSHDEAMEISQEAFVRAYRSIDNFDESRSFFTWYYRILKNLWLNSERDRKRRHQIRFIEVKRNEVIDDAESKYENNEMTGKLEEAIMLWTLRQERLLF
jgi:RNA polymerase sigma factor (sigma-70 family)